jgi:hypothetical protein
MFNPILLFFASNAFAAVNADLSNANLVTMPTKEDVDAMTFWARSDQPTVSASVTLEDLKLLETIHLWKSVCLLIRN